MICSELCLSTRPFIRGSAWGAAGEAEARRLLTAPGASVPPRCSAAFLCRGCKLVGKAIIVLNKMHLLRGMGWGGNKNQLFV